MYYVLADTGLWYALFDPRDPYHPQAKEKIEVLDIFRIVIPWPTMYETLRTKLVRNERSLSDFEKFLKKPNVLYLDDVEFRDAAFELSFESSLRQKRPLSMVDCLIRLLIEDKKTRINVLATFNPRDFRDVCHANGVELF